MKAHRFLTLALRGALALTVPALLVVAASGCARPKVPLVPPSGLIYTSIKAPLDLDFARAGTPTPVQASRTGTSRTRYVYIPFIGISFAWEDGSYEAAVQKADLQNITHADYEWMSILSIYQEVTFHVYGE